MSERVWSADYRYGFNGKEKDVEVYIANTLDFGSRILDSRLGRWLSIDPLFTKYSSTSPYTYAVCSPIMFYDGDGEDVIVGFTGGAFGRNKLTNVGNKKQFERRAKDLKTTGVVVQDAQIFAENSGIEFSGAVVSSGFSERRATRKALKFISGNYTKGEKIIIYGYSYGGKHALALTRALKQKGMEVELLETVDPTDGRVGNGKNSTIDFHVSENVKVAINYYQTIRETNGTMALGGQLEKSNEAQKVDNYLEENTTHQAIDEKVLIDTSKNIRSALKPSTAPPENKE